MAALIVAMVIPLLAVSAVQAATFTVANGDVTTLIADITAANGNGQDNTIALAAGGTYILTVANNGGARDANGLPVISSGHTLTINGNGATIEHGSCSPCTTPDFYRFFTINGGATLALNGLTLSGGILIGAVGSLGQDGQSVVGGAIVNSGALNLNTVTLGGVIQSGDGDTASASNGGSASGGVIYNNGGAIVGVNVAFSSDIIAGAGSAGHDDPAAPSAGGNGGSALGGGIYMLGGTLTLTNATFSSILHGGAGSKGGSGNPGHGAHGGKGGESSGGAIYSRGGQITLAASTLSDTVLDAGRGGISGNGGGCSPAATVATAPAARSPRPAATSSVVRSARPI
ncbi:MAG: hypothetical protein ACR2JW_20090 [Thermomicrobiales bacterium]